MKEPAGNTKVLMIVENNSFPWDRRVWREARTLERNGYRVFVISPKGLGEDRSKYEKIGGIHVYRYTPFIASTAGGYVVEYMWSLLAVFWLSMKIFARERFHVIHVANPPDIFFILAICFCLFDVRFIFDHHDLTPESYLAKFEVDKKGIIYKTLLLFEKLSARLSDVVIVTNMSYRDIQIERNGVDEERIFVVRNGPELSYFKPADPDIRLKGEFKYLACFIGIMARQDGVEYIVRAADHIVHTVGRNDIRFVLIGTGDDLGRLKRLAASLDVDGNICFTGRIPDKEAIDYLSTADICLSPDHRNPLNDLSTMNKIMEYMAMGKPVVSFRLKEAVFSAGDAALYVADNDPVSFADGILELLDDPRKRESMGAAGYERVKECLSWESQAPQLISAYQKLTSL